MRPTWDEAYWRQFEEATRILAVDAPTDAGAWSAIARRSRTVLRTYSTSFFLVTRFLPRLKRARVETVYAAVRYPDEVVDSFPLAATDRLDLLQQWGIAYQRALAKPSVQERLQSGIPATLAGFAQVVQDCHIPPAHYHSFLEAMCRDAAPRPFRTLDDLIESYVYGSAIVVGYFLAYIYGPSQPAAFDRALEASRDLGIALQLTNFLRDVAEDKKRGRVYMPEDLLRREGIAGLDPGDSAQLAPLRRVLRTVSAEAERSYGAAERNLDAFAPDCQTAIRACIDVYRLLNLRIGRSDEGVRHRESVPMRAKFQALPVSKYWRLPLAYLGAI